MYLDYFIWFSKYYKADMISTPIFIDANIQRKVREFFTLHKTSIHGVQ